MVNYCKYLSITEEDTNWGICTLDAGKASFAASEKYPAKTHPRQYFFNWSQGRVLHEYQLIYITRGEGIFESSRCPATKIEEGTIIMLFPNEWHRYRPFRQTGWDEYWIGFKGSIIDNLVAKGYFSPVNPVLKIGLKEKVLNIFVEIIESTKDKKPGLQPAISGALLHLLGLVHSSIKDEDEASKSFAKAIVEKALLILKSNADEKISIKKVAADLHVSYSWFRKMFKACTGVSPGQYVIHLKVEKAKVLLMDTSRSIKEIAYELNCKSYFNFSKLFKRKTSVSPQDYRKQGSGNRLKLIETE